MNRNRGLPETVTGSVRFTVISIVSPELYQVPASGLEVTRTGSSTRGMPSTRWGRWSATGPWPRSASVCAPWRLMVPLRASAAMETPSSSRSPATTV